MSRKRKRKVVKYRRRINVNLGTITFGVIFIYLVINIIISLGKETLSTYEVNQDIMERTINTTGIVVRNETLISTPSAGYVNYYIREGDRVAKNAVVYSIDETGKIYDYISQTTDDGSSISASDYDDIRDLVSVFNNYYDNNSFSDVYDFKYDLNNTIMELTNETAMKQLETALKESGITDSFTKEKSNKSGIITYSQDGFEDLKDDKVSKSCFDMTKYKKKQLKTSEPLKKGETVYKRIEGEDWSIIVPVTDKQLAQIKDMTTAEVKFRKDDFTIKATVATFTNKDGSYVKLGFDSYMVRYMNDRFLDIELIIHSVSGLKIPNTALTKKEFYRIPIAYLTSKSNELTLNSFHLQTMNKKGETVSKLVTPVIYKKDEKYCYVAVEDKNKDAPIQTGSIIVADGSKKTFQVSETVMLDGVYCVNKGYASFRLVTKIYSGDDHCIVEIGQDYGLALYDHIILNSDTIKENEKIY